MKHLGMIFLVFLLAVPCAFSQVAVPPVPAPPQVAPPPPPPPAGSGKWWKNSATVRALELTDAQVSQLEAVFLRHQEGLAGLKDTLVSEEDGLRTLLEAERLDEQAIAAQKQKVSDARLALINENEDMTLEMRRVMTADQWRKLEKIREERLIPAPPAPPVPPTPPVPPAPPPPPRLPAGAIIYDSDTPGLQEPVVMVQELAPYTEEARRARIEGIVLLEVDVDENGRVGSFRLLHGLGYGLDESAIRTIAEKWRFRPGTLDGKPVKVRVKLEMSFRLYEYR
jgi:TonB family protein